MRLSLFHLPQCIEHLREIRAMGITNVSLLANSGGLEHGKIMASLERFGKDARPGVP